MKSKRANISQIDKYLNGQLDAHAMHKFELEALDDPFLQDALEGYENAGKQQPNIKELAQRLQQRVEEKQDRVIPWMVWPIAASVILALTVGGLFLKHTPPQDELKTAAVINEKPSAPKQEVITAPPAVNPAVVEQAPLAVVVKKKRHFSMPDNAVYQEEISANDNIVSSNNKTTDLPADIIENPVAKKAESANNNNESVSDALAMSIINSTVKDSSAIVYKSAAKNARPLQSVIPGSVDGVLAVSSNSEQVAVDPRIISGVVLSKESGAPIIGAAIRVKGTNKTTVSDVNGKFSLSAAVSKPTLDIVSLGYQARQVDAGTHDSLKVELKENNNLLSEVVTTPYPVTRSTAKLAAAKSPQPQIGWDKFNAYLSANAYLPDGTTGLVSVGFTIAPDGTLGNFTIKKGLNEAANQKAISLIKNGPTWLGSSKLQDMVFKVKFQKKK